jgi:multiple sugar transport system substrate-binding protein
MKISKIVAVLMVVTLLVLSAAGCKSSTSPQKAKPVTITMAFMGDGANKATTQTIFDEFTKENPNIKVNVMFVAASGSSWNDYFTKIQTMVAGGNAPDLSDVAIEGAKMFVSTGLCMPIDQYIKGNADVKKELADMPSNLEAPFIQNGKTYGIAKSWNNVVMHFNTKLLAAAGLSVPADNWDMSTFLDYCKKLTKTVDGKKQFAVAIPNYWFGAEAWLYNNKGAFLNADQTKCTINDPNSVEMFQLWQDLVLKYKYAPYPDPNVDAIKQLIDGQVAMGSWGRWPVQEYKDNKFTDVAIQYLPSFKTNNVINGEDATFTLKNTKHPAEAVKVAVWMAGSYFVKNYYGYGNIPASKTVADEVIGAAGVPQNWQLFYKTATISTPVQAPVQYAAIATVYDSYITDILSKPVNVQTELDKAAAQINGILSNQ